jgi:predicted RNase H-like nuclease
LLTPAGLGEETGTTLVGADGARHGAWVVVLEEVAGAPELVVCRSTEDLFLELAQHRSVLAVLDVPIGLPARGLRECDIMARRLLAGARSTVFLAPPRPVIKAESQPQASRLWRDLDGRGCPAQTFGLFKRIREVDQELRRPGHALVFEGHPELAFSLLAGNGQLDSKHSAEGVAQRKELLASRFPDLGGWLAERPGLRGDVLDACACLLTARRLKAGCAHALPEQPIPRDPLGLPMAIWY